MNEQRPRRYALELLQPVFDWLSKSLGQVRRRLMLRAGAEGLVGLGLVVGAALLHLTWGGGAWMVLAAWGLGIFLCVWTALRVAQASEEDLTIARRIERSFPQLDTSVLNAVSFAPLAATTAAAAQAQLPQLFMEAELARAQRLLTAVEPRRAVSWERMRRLLALLGGFLLLNGASLGLRGEAYVAALRALSRPLAQFQVVVAKIKERAAAQAGRDILADVTVEVKYPAYTGLPPQRIVGGDGTVRAMLGSDVEISARSLESMDEAVLEIYGEPVGTKTSPALSLKADVAGGRLLSARFTVAVAGSYRVLIDGEPSRFYPVEVAEDLYPQVNMVEPATEREVTPDDRVDVRYNASDDFGLEWIDLVAQVSGRMVRKRLFEADDPATAYDGEQSLDLAALELTESDREVTVYVEAADNDTVSGPKTARSGQIVLALRSADRIHAAILADQERLLYGMVDWLGDALEPFPLPMTAEKEQLLTGYRALNESSRLVAEAFPDLLARMEEDEHADYNVYVALKNMGSELGRLRANLVTWSRMQSVTPSDISGPVAPLVAPLSGQAASHETPLERGIAYLDRLIYKQRIDDALRSEEEILEAKEDLARLLEEYKNTQDPELKKEILKRMQQLREKLAEALSRMSRLYEEMPDEFVNPEVREKLDEENLQELNDKLSRAFESGDLDAALQDFESFLSQVEQLMSGVRESSGQFNADSFFEDLSKIQEAEAEATKLEKAQQKLLDETQRLQDRSQPPQAQEQIARLMNEARKHLAQAGEELDRAASKESERLETRRNQTVAARSGDRNEQQRAQQAYQELQRQRLPSQLQSVGNQIDQASEELERLDTPAAEADILQALSRVERLEQNLEQLPPVMPNGAPSEPDTRGELSKAQRELRNAMSKLQQAKQAGQPRLSRQDRQQLQQMGEQQGQLEERTGDLAQKLEELAENSPMVESEAGEDARNAALSMRQAGERLGQGEPSAAVPSQASAQARLSQLRERLSEMRRRMEQAAGGGGAPMPFGLRQMAGRGKSGVNGGVANPQAEVELPDAGAYRVPPEFREEIIKSMKEPAPQEYEPLNEAYYRKLIR